MIKELNNMTVTMTRYGTKNGEQEYEYTMTNHNGLQALVLNYGATLGENSDASWR
jgi:galactose mutarotase-like enzyme